MRARQKDRDRDRHRRRGRERLVDRKRKEVGRKREGERKIACNGEIIIT